ncbi:MULTISPECIES: F0F1 ATP synthase subunit delta [unclassified Modestobacter]|uniref:F0F1 ATP synthase subunit delta n=1 Tax=unclassified Modestobacter TaxID=2643866 RepID=UPI0022AA5AB6|nr:MULTISPECIES: F0F1 ATP synthase subunit delta [unclassified Modestobacter]MCZ2812515.1 F0F1 ATP synthase subunit delta [Modestobacter sp. VKM Ac-2979]MCZ2841405.1 F0F1 ATP synthase subunit delta [Modestobacter sp. VKM Ac-2980]MCZ2850139.1 F0F1 ATP synthase subunit delta [Modestobacter sp. VKM Ac-2978]
MHASSRAAMEESRASLQEKSQGARSRNHGDVLLTLADELFAVANLLDSQPSLRRALSDASVRPDDRAGLAQRLLSGQLGADTLSVVETVARQRWSRPRDLVEATETLGTEAALDAADARGELEGVEDELFRFGRIVAGDADLARILGDRSAPREGKTALLDRLLSGRVSPVTERLVRNALTSSHVHNPENEVERLSTMAARRRGRSVAHVTSAVPLTAAQEQRLIDVLGRLYGRTMGLQVQVDPDVLGGLVVRVDDEVINGSIAARLEASGRRLAG